MAKRVAKFRIGQVVSMRVYRGTIQEAACMDLIREDRQD
jgi:hypothetical protein